jgi:hypothetical protein
MRFFAAFAQSSLGFLIRGSPQQLPPLQAQLPQAQLPEAQLPVAKLPKAQLQLQARLAADQLVAFVVAEETSKKPVDLETFLPQCLAHVERLIAEVDAAYTDAQLESVLQAECVRGEEFPHTASTGFDEASSCKEFATKLADARMKELETGSKVGYEEWCEAYFVEKAQQQAPAVQAVHESSKGGPSDDPPDDKPKEKKEQASIWAVIGLIFLVVLVIGGVYAMITRR